MLERPRRTYALDPPEWLARAERQVRLLPICPAQAEAARQLLRRLECDHPTPTVNADVRHGYRVASLMWCNAPRAVFAVPFALPPLGPGKAARLGATLTMWEGGEVWSGTRFAPVPMLRGMLGWVYGGQP